MNQKYITTTQAANLCNVSRFTVMNWADRNLLKSIKTLGGHRRIEVSTLLRVMSKRKMADQALLNRLKESTVEILAEEMAQQKKFIIPKKTRRPNRIAAHINSKKESNGLFQKGLFASGKYLASFKSNISNKSAKTDHKNINKGLTPIKLIQGD
ncbi:MAG: excisionase family DNA binding protein [Candidatus Omnitrophota bacterium]|jgi:excisionase family DNA binding protein